MPHDLPRGSLAGAKEVSDFETIIRNCAEMTAHAVHTGNDELLELAAYISAAARALIAERTQGTKAKVSIRRTSVRAQSMCHVAA